MANFHSRSNSFPSQSSHPAIDGVEAHLIRLRSSEATSISASPVCANLASLVNLHESINDLIQNPSIQQTLGQNSMTELLDGSLKLVDLCEFAREAVRSTKESIQDLESSIRRNKDKTTTATDISSYVTSRNKINKMINKYIKNFKSFNRSCTTEAVGTKLKEAEGVDFSVLKSVLILLSSEKEKSNRRSWSFLPKFSQTTRVHSEAEQETGAEDLCSLNIHKSQKNTNSVTLQNQLKATEMLMHELEQGLETLFRSLVKTRVSLLNVISH